MEDKTNSSTESTMAAMKVRQTVIDMLCKCQEECLTKAANGTHQEAVIYNAAAESFGILRRIYEQNTTKF